MVRTHEFSRVSNEMTLSNQSENVEHRFFYSILGCSVFIQMYMTDPINGHIYNGDIKNDTMRPLKSKVTSGKVELRNGESKSRGYEFPPGLPPVNFFTLRLLVFKFRFFFFVRRPHDGRLGPPGWPRGSPPQRDMGSPLAPSESSTIPFSY